MKDNVQLDSFNPTATEELGSPGDTGDVESHSTPAEGVSASENTGSDEYGTPRWLIRRLTDHQKFDLDPAAGAEPMAIAQSWFTEEDDGLSHPWTGPDIDSIYLNPPYSDPEPFLRKLKHAVDPDDDDAATYGISLTKSDTSTNWFHDHLVQATVLCFLDTRLKFHGGKQGAKFPNVLGVFGEPPEPLLDTIVDLGELYSRVEVNAAVEQQRLDDLIADGGCAATAIPVTTDSGGFKSRYASLDFVVPGDEIELTLDTDSLATRHKDIPERVRLTALPEGKEIEARTGSILIDTIGETGDGTDVCAQLRNSAKIVSHLEVSLAVGMDHWEIVTPSTVRLLS